MCAKFYKREVRGVEEDYAGIRDMLCRQQQLGGGSWNDS